MNPPVPVLSSPVHWIFPLFFADNWKKSGTPGKSRMGSWSFMLAKSASALSLSSEAGLFGFCGVI
jgi:hypothetical protein